MLLKYENQFINLGIALVDSVRLNEFRFNVCEICLNEMKDMVKLRMLNSLMLKKNPEIVNWIAKLCRFSDQKRTSREQRISKQSQIIRATSNELLNSLKVLMNFNGSNDAFMQFFRENVKLFHELTVNMSDIAKRQLTIDPESELMIDVNVVIT